KLLKQIHRTVDQQQERFGRVFREELLPALAEAGVVLVNEQTVAPAHGPFLERYFDEHVRAHLEPCDLLPGAEPPFLVNHALYLVLERLGAGDVDFGADASAITLLRVPTEQSPRFVPLPATEGRQAVIPLDDLIRYNLGRVFPGEDLGPAYAFKLSRDADLYLDDEFQGDLVDKVRASLAKRSTGVPSRLLYDQRTPYLLVDHVKRCFDLEHEDLVMGGRYHNFRDLFSFPALDAPGLRFPPLPPTPHPALASAEVLFDAIRDQDQLLHLPYQRYDEVLRFFDEAAADPAVESIFVTLYRVAKDSGVTRALMEAARQGKTVTAFVEVKARFDEAGNLYWAEQMAHAGVRVLYSLPHLKVHTKLAHVTRREDGMLRHYAYLGTGNFNEKTARIYTDFGLLTADPRLAEEVGRVFELLETLRKRTGRSVAPGSTEAAQQGPSFTHLLVAPHALRPRVAALLDHEIAEAQAGRPAGLTLKVNNLEDPTLIEHLYRASQAGVPIRLLVRGICRLVPGVEGISTGIEVRSLVGRFLEHARLYWFHHSGAERLYLASADWMTRNMDRRVEVAFPIYDPAVHQELTHVLDLQWHDTVKARVLDADLRNAYHRPPQAPVLDAQQAHYAWLAERVSG
ncbi:MAG: polyphosphate kinase 1, partial [Bacteroidota bacterium]